MPKYKSEIKDYILNNVDIEDVISSYVTLKRAGANLKGLCPFHGEKTPSFFVSKNWQNYHCFGCSERGDAISFIMKMENLDFISALEYLAETNGLDISPYLDEHAAKPDKRVYTSYDINLEAAKYYRENLFKSPHAIEYLEDRKLNRDSIISFGLGYSLDAWDGLYKHLKLKGYSDEDLLYSKLVKLNQKETSIYDSFRNRIMFPIFDNRKRVVGFGARSLGSDMPKYINSSESQIFRKSKILYGQGVSLNVKNDILCVLVEGYMDVIKLNQIGVHNVYASMGTSLTEEQVLEISKRYKKLVFAYDMDEAGRTAIDRSLSILEKYTIDIRVLEIENAKDPDEYINKFGGSNFKERLDLAIDIYRYKIKRLKRGLNLKNASDRRLYIDKSISFLSDLDDKVELELFIQELSLETGIDSEIIMTEYNSHKGESSDDTTKKVHYSNNNDKALKIKKTKLDIIEEKILEIGICSKDKYFYIMEQLDSGLVNQELSLALISLKEYYSNIDVFNLKRAVDIIDLQYLVILEKYYNKVGEEITMEDLQKLLIKREQELCLMKINVLTEELNELLLYKDRKSEVNSRLKQNEIIQERKKFSTLLDAEKLI